MNKGGIRALAAPDKACSLRLVLMRHGEPAKQAHGRCYGSLDVGLSEAGREQIRSRMDLLRSLAPHVMYTSTRKRSIESAHEIRHMLGMEARTVPDLCEIDFGAFEGLTYAEIEGRYPQEYKQWMEHPTEITFPDGESFQTMKNRIIGFLASLFHNHGSQTVLTISHGGVNRILLADALGLPDDKIFRIEQAYAAVNVIDYRAQSALVRLVNG
jgi:broad specificity phosphatase PhoE